MIKSITVGILTSTSIRDKENGKAFLEMLEPAYAPERYNDHEPIRLTYDRENISQALKLWGNTFLWRRSKPRLLGSAWMGLGSVYKIHDAIYIKIPMKACDEDEILRLFEGIDARFGIDIAYIHAETAADAEDREYYGTYISNFSQGLTTHDLRKGLPGLCWITLFGRPYRTLFGDRLSDVPAFSVRDLGTTCCIKLTEHVKDVDREREAYLQAKRIAIEHLHSNAFRGLTPRGSYNVPEFHCD